MIALGSMGNVIDHFCPDLRRLLEQATSKKRKCDWKFVWVKNGQMFARNAEAAPTVIAK